MFLLPKIVDFINIRKKIGTTNENWLMRQGRGNICFRFVATEAPPQICCQFVILLKSCSWQYMWGSNPIFKNCRKSRFFENLRISDWFWFEWSTCASGAIFDAESNIASLLLIFNKNVVFRQQMLIFHVFIHSFTEKSEN